MEFPLDSDRQLFAQVAHHSSSHLHRPRGHHFKQLFFGANVILRPWFTAPFPAEYYRTDGVLWMCDKCLRYFAQSVRFERHMAKCRLVAGCEVYREQTADSVISAFKIDGADDKTYCQALCLLAKLFLDHKTLYYDTDSFYFYTLYEWACHDNLYTPQFVGYFSKEKHSPSGYNLSCILVLPQFQKRGYGTLLIDLSYMISRTSMQIGTPEKPLSDLGLVSYVRYWSFQVLQHRHHLDQPDGIQKIARLTGMTENDVMATLEYLGVVYKNLSGNIFIDDKPLEECRNTGSVRTANPRLFRDSFAAG